MLARGRPDGANEPLLQIMALCQEGFVIALRPLGFMAGRALSVSLP